MPVRLLALTLLLLPLRLDAGQNVWTPIGPEGGLVTALAVAPNGRTVYAGTPAGGVFKSINTGRSWLPVNEGLSGRVMDLEVAATAPQVVYAATSEGLFQSRNAGASWTDLTLRLPGISGPALTLLVATSPIEPGAVYASLFGNLFHSSDAGATWERVAGLPFTVQAVVPHPRQPGVVFAGTADGIYRSSDSGRTWRRSGLAGYDVVQIAFDPLRPERLYAVRSLDGERFPDLRCEVYVSEQAGRRWQRADAGVESGRNPRLVADPLSPGTAYLSVENSRGSLYRTTDGGRRWQAVQEGYAIWALAANPGVRGMLFLARPHYDGTSVLRSTDAGRSWTPSASGIQAQEVRRIVTAPGVLYAQAGCCKPWKTEDGGLTWTPIGPALTPPRNVFDITVDPATPTTVYASVNDGSLYRSRDAGATWSRIALFQSTGTLHLTGLQVDPANPDTLYGLSSLSRPLKSTNGGADWAPLPYVQSQQALVLTVVPGPPTTLYANGVVGTFGGLSYEDRVNRSMDGGATWTPLLTISDTYFTDFAADPRLPGRILASYVDTETKYRLPVAGGVYLSTDGGLHWSPFPVAPQTLPPLFSLALDPRDPLRVYAGAAGAVFLSEDGGITWNDTGAGLPPAEVVDLQVDPDSPDTVYAATFGGSVYAFTHTTGH